MKFTAPTIFDKFESNHMTKESKILKGSKTKNSRKHLSLYDDISTQYALRNPFKFLLH